MQKDKISFLLTTFFRTQNALLKTSKRFKQNTSAFETKRFDV